MDSDSSTKLLSTFDRVREVVERETGQSPIERTTRLDSLGMDSLDFMSLLAALKEIDNIPQERYMDVETVGELAAILEMSAT